MLLGEGYPLILRLSKDDFIICSFLGASQFYYTIFIFVLLISTSLIEIGQLCFRIHVCQSLVNGSNCFKDRLKRFRRNWAMAIDTGVDSCWTEVG